MKHYKLLYIPNGEYIKLIDTTKPDIIVQEDELNNFLSWLIESVAKNSLPHFIERNNLPKNYVLNKNEFEWTELQD